MFPELYRMMEELHEAVERLPKPIPFEVIFLPAEWTPATGWKTARTSLGVAGSTFQIFSTGNSYTTKL